MLKLNIAQCTLIVSLLNRLCNYAALMVDVKNRKKIRTQLWNFETGKRELSGKEKLNFPEVLSVKGKRSFGNISQKLL